MKNFGGDYPVEKEDCIDHIQKRMDTALRTYKNKAHDMKLSDGKGVGGTGRLTDVIVDQIQTYYGYSIRNNLGDVENISNAIWAIFFHLICGPPGESLDEQHKYFPITPDTWCRYQKDKSTYDRKKCLPLTFRNELKAIFERRSSREMLHSCQRGLTQNQNELLNSVVWSRCPKRVFCGVHHYTIAICEAVSQFNNGARGRYYFFKTLNVEVGDNFH